MAWFAALSTETQAALISAGAGALGGIIGSVVTIGVTWSTLRNERERLAAQLAHEAQEAKRERDLSLRRELLTAAADDALAQVKTLTSITNVNIPVADLAASSGPLSGLAKVHMAGSLATIQAFDAIAASLRDAIYSLLTVRARHDATKSQIELLTDRIESEREQINDLYPPSVRASWAHVPADFSQRTETLAAVFAHRRDLLEALSRHQLELFDQALRSSVEYSAALGRANVEARRDLEQADTFDVAEYSRHVERVSRETLESSVRFLKSLRIPGNGDDAARS